MTVTQRVEGMKPNDYASDQEVRWCPGCGDYAILKAIQRTLAELGAPREKTVFVSGIGCSSRLPYYMDTYGFHTIHGRAPAFATGIKLANPELDVWMVTGDGDGLSIGGNHLIHMLRRNVDLQVLLFNNEIYGLTKGQYSPASRVGTRSPSTPYGSIEAPLSACSLALGAGARFIARGIDTSKDLTKVLSRARAHEGASFVEIYQNCIVYNDKVFAEFTERDVAADRQVHAVHGEPLRFGKDGEKGLRLKPGKLEIEIVSVGGDDGVSEDSLLVHDETNHTMAAMLASLKPPEFPVVLGVLYCAPAPTYEKGVHDRLTADRSEDPMGNFKKLLKSGHTWTVDAP